MENEKIKYDFKKAIELKILEVNSNEFKKNKIYFTFEKIVNGIYRFKFNDNKIIDLVLSRYDYLNLLDKLNKNCLYKEIKIDKNEQYVRNRIKEILEKYNYKKIEAEKYNIKLDKNKFLLTIKNNIDNIEIFEWIIAQDNIIEFDFYSNLNKFHNHKDDFTIFFDENVIYQILKESLIKQNKEKEINNPLKLKQKDNFYYMPMGKFKIKEETYDKTNKKFDDIFINCICSKDKHIIENFKIREKFNRKVFKFKLENNLDLEDVIKRFYIAYNYDKKFFELIETTKGLSNRQKYQNISVPIIYFDNENIAQKFTDEVLLSFIKEYPNFKY